MSTLAEIEAAAEQLPVPQKEELLAFLAARLGRQSDVIAPQFEGDSYPRLTTDPDTGLPLVLCHPDSVVNPTKEQLSDF